MMQRELSPCSCQGRIDLWRLWRSGEPCFAYLRMPRVCPLTNKYSGISSFIFPFFHRDRPMDQCHTLVDRLISNAHTNKLIFINLL